MIARAVLAALAVVTAAEIRRSRRDRRARLALISERLAAASRTLAEIPAPFAAARLVGVGHVSEFGGGYFTVWVDRDLHQYPRPGTRVYVQKETP